ERLAMRDRNHHLPAARLARPDRRAAEHRLPGKLLPLMIKTDRAHRNVRCEEPLIRLVQQQPAMPEGEHAPQAVQQRTQPVSEVQIKRSDGSRYTGHAAYIAQCKPPFSITQNAARTAETHSGETGAPRDYTISGGNFFL